MEKQGVEDAQNAARAAAWKVSTSAATTSGNTKVYMQLTSPKGKVYLVEEGDLGKLQTLSNGMVFSAPTGFAGLTMDNIEWEGWMAYVEEELTEPKTSVNWTKHFDNANNNLAEIASLN
ncbi:hypothetical protein H2248_001584 [Termitomyces sp. 'cryptogamus']|nr:hypothetical protein H2248_001584 [Termitomyces sp. 'cryptogamus']